MLDVTFRKVELSDADALARLIADFRDHLKAQHPTDDEIASRLPPALADSALEFTCAWQKDEAVGYAQTRFITSVWADGLEAHLEDLFVASAVRGRFVGRGLLRYVIALAQARHVARLTLNTNERNATAHSLYRSEGFAPQTHKLYSDGREVVWSLDLGAASASARVEK